jgi:hypothetical protein
VTLLPFAHVTRSLAIASTLQDVEIRLPGLELEGFKAQRSALLAYAAKQLQAQALAIVFNVFK